MLMKALGNLETVADETRNILVHATYTKNLDNGLIQALKSQSTVLEQSFAKVIDFAEQLNS